MNNKVKQAWEAPVLESLDVKMTMAGSGTKYTDWAYVGGKHELQINDDPANSAYPAPPMPPCPS